ncbi:MAG: hypothetical protein BGP04_08795 [Rhizobiales bacterium 62-17]|nr:helix-turn-helix domain-containing protein [Hyphomicrobiales bacterium]OJY05469.1 MAG: hypothetical protein BGP04_08795 [Rhizobiales bacterium 62-17]
MEKLALSIEDAINAGPFERTRLYELINSGELPAHKNGRRTYIMTSDFRRFLESMPFIVPSKEKPASGGSSEASLISQSGTIQPHLEHITSLRTSAIADRAAR